MAKLPITTINGVEIYAESNEKGIFVPVKPICQALGIDDTAQKQRIHRHYILNSVEVTLTSTGTDGKCYEMLCLPLEFAYGWLFTIDANLVTESRREAVAAYQRECYDALYDHFSGSMQRTIETNTEEIRLLQEQNELLLQERALKARRRENEKKLEKLRAERLNPQPRLL